MLGSIKLIIGGIAAISLGFMLFAALPADQKWRSLAAFVLGGIFIYAGVKGIQPEA